MGKQHNYAVSIQWTGNIGNGTTRSDAYERSHTIYVKGKQDIPASSDIPFRGDASKHNPEDMLLASISSCHMLWYLHLCADAGVIVTDYVDHATGTMVEVPSGGGHFTEVVLHPHVTVTDVSMIEKANALHHRAHECCFIANSCNFTIRQEPTCMVK
ncbi:MAG: OsmC family protein [Bacteroidota bacterium]